MISPAFYNKKNLVKTFCNGKVLHYPIKSGSVTLDWFDYVIKEGETLYSLSERVFGKGLDYMWSLIADNNPIRHPDEWQAGDIIRLPKVIIKDSDTSRQL